MELSLLRRKVESRSHDGLIVQKGFEVRLVVKGTPPDGSLSRIEWLESTFERRERPSLVLRAYPAGYGDSSHSGKDGALLEQYYPGDSEHIRLRLTRLRPVKIKRQFTFRGLRVENRHGNPHIYVPPGSKAVVSPTVTLSLVADDPPVVRPGTRVKRIYRLKVMSGTRLLAGRLSLVEPRPEALGFNFLFSHNLRTPNSLKGGAPSYPGLDVKIDTPTERIDPTQPIRFGPIDKFTFEADLTEYVEEGSEDVILPVHDKPVAPR